MRTSTPFSISMTQSKRLGRITIAIYNSYDPNNFREAHRRILARAGPLALAFDCNLATFGFPFPKEMTTPQEIADWVATTTSIGEDGSYLRELTTKGRFQTHDYPNKGFLPQLGEVVLTTCSPAKGKKRSVDDVALMVLDGQGVCLVFGAGPKGVPKEVHRFARNHMDVTFGEFSLETCTAMGACVAVLAHKVRQGVEVRG